MRVRPHGVSPLAFGSLRGKRVLRDSVLGDSLAGGRRWSCAYASAMMNRFEATPKALRRTRFRLGTRTRSSGSSCTGPFRAFPPGRGGSLVDIVRADPHSFQHLSPTHTIVCVMPPRLVSDARPGCQHLVHRGVELGLHARQLERRQDQRLRPLDRAVLARRLLVAREPLGEFFRVTKALGMRRSARSSRERASTKRNRMPARRAATLARRRSAAVSKRVTIRIVGAVPGSCSRQMRRASWRSSAVGSRTSRRTPAAREERPRVAQVVHRFEPDAERNALGEPRGEHALAAERRAADRDQAAARDRKGCAACARGPLRAPRRPRHCDRGGEQAVVRLMRHVSIARPILPIKLASRRHTQNESEVTSGPGGLGSTLRRVLRVARWRVRAPHPSPARRTTMIAAHSLAHGRARQLLEPWFIVRWRRAHAGAQEARARRPRRRTPHRPNPPGRKIPTIAEPRAGRCTAFWRRRAAATGIALRPTWICATSRRRNARADGRRRSRSISRRCSIATLWVDVERSRTNPRVFRTTGSAAPRFGRTHRSRRPAAAGDARARRARGRRAHLEDLARDGERDSAPVGRRSATASSPTGCPSRCSPGACWRSGSGSGSGSPRWCSAPRCRRGAWRRSRR